MIIIKLISVHNRFDQADMLAVLGSWSSSKLIAGFDQKTFLFDGKCVYMVYIIANALANLHKIGESAESRVDIVLGV